MCCLNESEWSECCLNAQYASHELCYASMIVAWDFARWRSWLVEWAICFGSGMFRHPISQCLGSEHVRQCKFCMFGDAASTVAHTVLIIPLTCSFLAKGQGSFRTKVAHAHAFLFGHTAESGRGLAWISFRTFCSSFNMQIHPSELAASCCSQAITTFRAAYSRLV